MFTEYRHGSDAPPGESLVANATRQLRSAILTAELAPGTRLRTEALQDRFGFSSSPLREALNRLASEGLIEAEDRRGFRVKPVSVEELNDITRVRLLLESEALKDSMKHGDVEWEAGVIAAFHRLSAAQGRLAGGAMVVDQHWSARHREFHFALLGACTSRNLLELCAVYFVQSERYRHVTAAFRTYSVNALAEHQRLMKSTLAKHEKPALELLAAHIRRATHSVVAALEARPFSAAQERRAARA